MLNILQYVNKLLLRLLLHVSSFIYFLKHKLRHYYFTIIYDKLVASPTPPAVYVDHLSVSVQGNTVLLRMKSKQSSTFELDHLFKGNRHGNSSRDVPVEVNRK